MVPLGRLEGEDRWIVSQMFSDVTSAHVSTLTRRSHGSDTPSRRRTVTPHRLAQGSDTTPTHSRSWPRSRECWSVGLDGWVDGWLDGWVIGWTDHWMVNRWVGGWMDGWMVGQMGGWVDSWTGGWLDRWVDGLMVGRVDGWTDGWMDGCLDEWMDGWMDGG